MFGVISILIFVLTPVLLFYVLFLIMMLFFLASLSLNPGGVGHGPKGIMGKKIKNGSFASDLRFVHISRYAIKIPGEIV